MPEAAPHPQPADVETATDAYARRFAGPIGEWMLNRQLNAVQQLLGPPGKRSVLDVGGGHGQLALPLAKLGFRVTVHGSADCCRSRLESALADGTIDFCKGNLLALPFDEQTFDTVVCIRLLPHCPEWRTLISELCRVARSLVVVDYPTIQSVNVFSRLTFGWKKKVERNTRPFALFTHRDIRLAFSACGFQAAGRIGQFTLPMALHRVIQRPSVSRTAEEILCRLGMSRLLGSPVLAAFVPGEDNRPAPAKRGGAE